MKLRLIVLSLIATPAFAAEPPPSMPAATAAPATTVAAPAPTAADASTEKMFAFLKVDSMKPTLSARNVYVIKGNTANGVAGGWKWDTSYQINDETKTVQVTLAAWAPKGTVATRAFEKFEQKVEIKELAGPAYSGKPGKYDVILVDQTGKELFRTVYEVKTPAGG